MAMDRPEVAMAVVLFVDDEAAILKGFTRALRNEPYVLRTATSAKDARTILASEPVDVVVSDEVMPGESGSDFLAWLRREYPRVVRIMLTGAASPDVAAQAVREGKLYRFLSKPISCEDLARTLRDAVRMNQNVESRTKVDG
jgi:DNA-binding NtrC family response regulator